MQKKDQYCEKVVIQTLCNLLVKVLCCYVLHRKLLVGQRPSFPHRDLTLGSGHGVKTGLPCCLETVSLRAIYVYPFVLKEVKKTVTSHCFSAVWVNK